MTRQDVEDMNAYSMAFRSYSQTTTPQTAAVFTQAILASLTAGIPIGTQYGGEKEVSKDIGQSTK